MNKLTTQFIKQEEENFALFSYVTELNDEVESLQSRVAALRADIDKQRELNIERGKKQEETLQVWEQELERETRLADQTEAETTRVILPVAF